jgi:hypothetical protein
MFTEQASERTWNATAGWQRVRVWEGPESELDGFYASVAPPGYVASRESFKPLGQTSAGDPTVKHWMRVELTYGIQSSTGEGADPGLISRNWSMKSVEEQVHILSHDSTIPLWKRSSTWVQQIKACAENYETRVRAALAANPTGSLSGITVPTPATPAEATSGEIAAAAYLLGILTRDQNATGFLTRHTLRKTEVVNSLTALTAVHTNVNRPFTYAGLTANEPTLPGAALINAAGLTGLKWLKKAPDVDQLGGGLYQIVQEYESGAYFDPYLYGAEITS